MEQLLPDFSGDYDNFLQYWKQNTEEEMHRDNSPIRHEHIHVKIEKEEDFVNGYKFLYYTGRNNRSFIKAEKVQFSFSENSNDNGFRQIRLVKENETYRSESGSFIWENGTLWIDGLNIYPLQNDIKYKLNQCRYFSGWIQCPIDEDSDDLYAQRDLVIHDQGGLVALDYQGKDYTIELTQLDFAHTIKVMKLAIYDVSLDKVEINSKAISYTWTNPEAKRLGINLRKVISGWTYIEEGYLSSNKMNSIREGEKQ